MIAQQLSVFDSVPRTILVFKSGGKQSVGFVWRYSIWRVLQEFRNRFTLRRFDFMLV